MTFRLSAKVKAPKWVPFFVQKKREQAPLFLQKQELEVRGPTKNVSSKGCRNAGNRYLVLLYLMIRK